MRVLAASSPNFDKKVIDVEFLVLHYTGCDLAKTLEIFSAPKPGVTSHFVIDSDGTVYDLGAFLKGAEILKGAHAGASSFKLLDKEWTSLNDCSIGIELVNLNGNLFEYTDAQYLALSELVTQLSRTYPKLKSADRIVGHEQIAGVRGKVDPGLCFDWQRFYDAVYGKKNAKYPLRDSVLNEQDLKNFLVTQGINQISQESALDWCQLSLALEDFSKNIIYPKSGLR